jgi:hypothetical protein
MKTSPQILAASNLNPKDKRVVVVEGVDPHEVQRLLPDVLIFVQGTSEDFGDTIFSSEEGVLNVLKPNLFVSDDPTPEDIKLCASFGCVVNSLEHLKEELRILGSVEPDIYEMPEPNEINTFGLDMIYEGLGITETSQDIEDNNAQTI